MPQKLYILLDDNTESFCYYSNACKRASNLIPIHFLYAGLQYACDNNLGIYIVYPQIKLPQPYMELLSGIKHKSITFGLNYNADINVLNKCQVINRDNIKEGGKYILRTSKADLFKNWHLLPFESKIQLDIILEDIETFTEDDFKTYHMVTANLADKLTTLDNTGMSCNIINQRIKLNEMQNCGAGETSITLAPDGCFYVCPGFYYNGYSSIGEVTKPLDVKNKQLYTLKYAPICSHCDAYHCKRCVYLNIKTTLEVNTPSHEQCVVSHIERSASRQLLLQLQDKGLATDYTINEVPYNDPFDVRNEWK